MKNGLMDKIKINKEIVIELWKNASE